MKRFQNINGVQHGIYLALLFTVTCAYLGGCTASTNIPPVPDELIETVVIAWETGQGGWIYENAYWYGGPPESLRDYWIDKTTYTDSEREILLEMLRDNYTYRANYDGTKATIVVDITETGIPEWENVNKMGLPPTIQPTIRHYYKNMLFHFFYQNGKWLYYANPGDASDWPEPEFVD